MEIDRLYGREEHFDAFTDLLFNALLGFAFMFFIAFLLINPGQSTGKVDVQAEFIIRVTWPDNHTDDIDTFVQDPDGRLVWYKKKEAGLLHLDRDDRGMFRDTILVKGERISSPLNQEVVSLRGIVPGEYVVNVFHFLASGTEPVPVNVTIEKINPEVTVVYYTTVELDHTGHEVTVVRFTVAPDGSVSKLDFSPKSLVPASASAVAQQFGRSRRRAVLPAP